MYIFISIIKRSVCCIIVLLINASHLRNDELKETQSLKLYKIYTMLTIMTVLRSVPLFIRTSINVCANVLFISYILHITVYVVYNDNIILIRFHLMAIIPRNTTTTTTDPIQLTIYSTGNVRKPGQRNIYCAYIFNCGTNRWLSHLLLIRFPLIVSRDSGNIFFAMLQSYKPTPLINETYYTTGTPIKGSMQMAKTSCSTNPLQLLLVLLG